MPATRLHFVVLPIAAVVLLSQAGCKRTGDEPVAAQAQALPAWSLDESKLIQPIRFNEADLDPSTSPCKDLAGYVNDKWLTANPIPSDQTSWGVGDVLRQRSLGIQRQLAERAAALPAASGVEKIVADFWRTGMDEARVNAQGLEPLRDRLAAIDELSGGRSVSEYLRKVAAKGENPLFGFGSGADFKDSAMNIAYAIQGGLGLPDKTYYFDADKQPLREAYERHISKVLQLTGVPAEQVALQARTVLAFETRLAHFSSSAEELSGDLSLYYNPTTLAAADKLTPNFPWTVFFAAQGVAAPKMFSLSMPAFHQEVSRMLADVPVAQWQSYLRYHLVDDASPYLSDAFVTEHFDFHGKSLEGQEELQPRWKRVLGAVNDSAGEPMGQLYVEVAFPVSSKTRMEQLFANLREALKVRIENLGWMSDETKRKALEKWATFTPKIGYPDKWRDWSDLATQRGSYIRNVYAAREFAYRRELGKIGQPVDKTEWNVTPQTVSGYYDPLQNEIVFPAAILQPPFFDAQADAPLVYGAIGALIGHELTHGYDDQGSRFGPTGNFEQWWTDADAAKFKALTEKLVKQYNSYEAAPGLRVNGSLTLGENIADLGGLNVAYDAMLRAVGDKPDPKIDGLSRDQRFFIGWATVWRKQLTPERLKVHMASDEHSPPRIGANGPPTNVPAFAAAFGCKAGDPMVHSGENLVVIW
jgi:putative endopeptidase